MGLAALLDSLRCVCPRCRQGALYDPGLLNLTLRDTCASCGLDLKKNDSADGPAVFLIFILGALLVPAALVTDALFSPPLWFHAVFWGALALGITVGSLKSIKAVVITIQYRHRPGDWEHKT
ncbi:MAG: DUF983 domain-containing protein [Pseudobdellovibrionaceae bacterium]